RTSGSTTSSTPSSSSRPTLTAASSSTSIPPWCPWSDAMRQFYTVVLDTFKDLDNGYATEPYEAAWASEAIFYVRVDQVRDGAGPLELVVEFGPDGMAWVEEGGTLTVDTSKQLSFIRVTHFGGWLRLRHTSGPAASVQATVYLVLK